MKGLAKSSRWHLKPPRSPPTACSSKLLAACRGKLSSRLGGIFAIHWAVRLHFPSCRVKICTRNYLRRITKD